MSYGPGGAANPYDQRDGPAPGGYGASAAPQAQFGQGPRPGGGPRYNHGPAIGRDEYAPNNVEMSSLTQNASSFSSSNPNAILNECRDIDRGVDQIEQNLQQLRILQDRSLNETDTSSGSTTSRQLDQLSIETMALYRGLTDRVRAVKSTPAAQLPKNAPQVSRIDRRLKTAIQQYQQVEASHRKRTQDQMARQYRIVRPDADEKEIRAVVEDPVGGQQVFQQALMQSGRQGQARAALGAVQDRHAEIQRIEQQMRELAQLFQDLDTLVLQQETPIASIEAKGEEVAENLDKGNQELGTAVNTARATRRKKWWCLGISVAIVFIVVIVIIIIKFVVQAPASGKKRRDIAPRAIDDLQMNNNGVHAIEVGPGSVSRFKGHIVVPDAEYATKREVAAGTFSRLQLGGPAKSLVKARAPEPEPESYVVSH